MHLIGDPWCKMMAMSQRRRSGAGRKRLTISFDQSDYDRLKELADSHRPRLTLQYVVEYAVQVLLERGQDPQFMRHIGTPMPNEDIDGHC